MPSQAVIPDVSYSITYRFYTRPVEEGGLGFDPYFWSLIQILGDVAMLVARPQHYHDLGSFIKLPPKLEADTVHVKPSARTRTAAPHCGSHCYPLHVVLTLQFLFATQAVRRRRSRP